MRFGGGVTVMGAPLDPAMQRISPTPGVTDRDEVWVSFLVEDFNVNALGFCQETHQKTKTLLEQMSIVAP